MSDFSFLQDMLNDAVAQGVFPAAVAAVGAKNRTLCACAAGSATPNTRFDLASMTKVVSTTMLALCAVEKGLITLGDTLGRFFCSPAGQSGYHHLSAFDAYGWL